MVATLAKMAVPTYYIESQAAHEGHEGEDPGDPEAEGGYYTGGGKERPGEWYNPAGLFRLKDGGLVRDKTFYALAGGFSPGGTSLVRNAGSERRSPGFDLTFSADKSISALWALSPADEREAIERAVIDAARRALADTIFRHCATTRVGAGGRRVEPGAMLAATFLHRTSRDGDPQLHVHATLFNLVKTHADGEFRALHGYPLYSWKMAAGAAFRSHLAYLMRRHLGIEMERHGPEGQYTRVAAMDPDLEQAWSKRRREIVETVGGSLGEEALTNPAQMAAATLATRRRKGEGATTGEDLARFRKEAAALVDLEALRQRVRETPVADVTEAAIDRVREEVAAIPARLARMDAVFRQPDMVEKAENALAGLVASDAAERWHEFSLTAADLVPLAYREPNADAGMAHKRLFTTRDTLEAEQRLQRLSQSFVQAPVVPAETVEAKLQALRAEGKTVSPEQTHAIHHATSHRLALIEGAAGSGKSHILHPLAQLWRGEGKTVRALAVAWRTAVDLGTDMQAPPAAVYPFLRAVARGTKTVDENTVLVVDEAGMLSVRQALQLVELARTTGCQLVLVGDTQQQQPVEAGPGLRLLRDAVGSVRIDHIRRQLPDLEDWLREVDSLSADEAAAQATGRAARAAARARFREMNRARAGEKPITIRRPWQRGVSALLRNGAMDMAFKELHRRGRMGLVDGKEEALHDLVARWAAYTGEHPTHSTIVMARTRADVRALSVLLRARHHAMGDRRHKDDRSAIIRVHRIGDRGRATAVPLEVRLGERLRIGATVYDLGLYNGTIVTVIGIEPRKDGHCRLTVQTADKRTVTFAPEEIRNWLGETALDHGYATTVTAAQGMTVDAAFLLLDEAMARETTYPACTRHRRHLELVADRQSVAVGLAGATPEGAPGRTVGDDEILASLGQLCGRSQPKAAALDHLLAETRREREGEIGREPTRQADGLDPGTAGPQDRRRAPQADRAALRIVAAADRRTRRLADRATAVALAADMAEVERGWAAMPALADPAVRRQLDRHRAVLHRVRVFLRRRRSGREDGQHHPRISGLGYVAFQSLHRRMQRPVRARAADKAQRAAVETRSLARRWAALRARFDRDLPTILEDPEHARLLRRTVAFGRETDRDTDWRSFLDGHYAALGAALDRAWRTGDRQGWWHAPVSPHKVSGYAPLRRRAEAFWSALNDGVLRPGDYKAASTLWRRRLNAAPSYRDVLIRLMQTLGTEEGLMRRREAQLPGSTLATRRLADHMAALTAATHLEGLSEVVRRLVRQHRAAREAAGVTRTDAPWVSDRIIAARVEARALNRLWQEIGTGTLALLDRPDHGEVIARTAAFAAKLEQRQPDTARKWRALAEGHLRQLARQLDEAFESDARDVEALDGWLRLPRRLDAFAALLAALPPAMAERVGRADWQRRLAEAPSPVAVYERFVRDLAREEHTIREQETARPGSTLATRRLADHMAVLAALASHDLLPAGEREGFQRLLDAHREARVDAGVTAADHSDEIRQRNEISRTIAEARAHLLKYPALLERAPKLPPDQQDSRVFRRMRRFFEDDMPPTKGLKDFDPDYRKWDLRAELFVRKFRTWRADPILRDLVDRRWIDMADLIAEFEAIRHAYPEPYRIEIPDAFPASDQRHDSDRLAVLLRDVIRPVDERSRDAVVELARRNRAWPEETLAVFRSHARQAANAGETRSLIRLSAGLPPHLGASLRNLSEVTWQYQGEDIERRRNLEQGYGVSY